MQENFSLSNRVSSSHFVIAVQFNYWERESSLKITHYWYGGHSIGEGSTSKKYLTEKKNYKHILEK